MGPEFAVKVRYMADSQNHHPEPHVHYQKYEVDFTTHCPHGVSRNDFICAAKADEIFGKILESVCE